MTEDLSDISGPALCFAFFIGNELANLGLVECPLLADPSRAKQFPAAAMACTVRIDNPRMVAASAVFDAFWASCGVLHNLIPLRRSRPCALRRRARQSSELSG
jgi:hypothetical protein